MLVVRTIEDPADSVSELISAKQSLGLCNLAFGVDPLGLYSIEPRALGGQQARYYPYPMAAGFDFSVVRCDPLSQLSAFVPACVVPDKQQGLLASRLESVATPPEKLRAYGAQWAAVHEPQPALFEFRHIQPVAGESLQERAFVASLGSSFLGAFWRRRTGSPTSAQECRDGLSKSEKTKSHPGSPKPTEDRSGQAVSADLQPLFSGIFGIGALDPSLRPLPAHPKPC